MKTFLDTPVPNLKKFLAHFKDPLSILLLIASLILLAAWLLEGSRALLFEALVIVAIVGLNAIIGYIQEARAEELRRQRSDGQGSLVARHPA
jgi:Ca2+-transporting ATPase